MGNLIAPLIGVFVICSATLIFIDEASSTGGIDYLDFILLMLTLSGFSPSGLGKEAAVPDRSLFLVIVNPARFSPIPICYPSFLSLNFKEGIEF